MMTLTHLNDCYIHDGDLSMYATIKRKIAFTALVLCMEVSFLYVGGCKRNEHGFFKAYRWCIQAIDE